MMSRLHHLFLLPVLVLTAAAAANAAEIPEDQLDSLRTIQSRTDEGLRLADFACTYAFSTYVVDTQEEAEQFDTSSGRLVVHATGKLAKSGTMAIESFKLDKLETKHDFAYVDYISVTSPELTAEYERLYPELPPTLFVSRRHTDPGFPFLRHSYLGISGITSPLSSEFRVVDSLLDRAKRGTDETTLSVSQDGTKTVIDQHFVYLPNLDQKSLDRIAEDFPQTKFPITEVFDTAYTISNEYDYPVLTEKTEITRTFSRETRRGFRASRLELLENGSVLPKRIESYSPIISDNYGEDAVGKWKIIVWESEDLGKKKPKKSDFIIPFNRKSEISGLAVPFGKKLMILLTGRFNINAFNASDVGHGDPPLGYILKTGFLIWYRPILIAGCGFLLLVWFCFVRRAGKRRKAGTLAESP